MNKAGKISPAWSVPILLSIPTGVLLLLFLVPVPGFVAALEVPVRLLAGFAFFLAENLPRLSTDAGTWGPGLAAFCIAVLVAHRLLRRRRRWPLSATVCAALFLPLIFAVSFLVPGVLLQIRALMEGPWFESSRRSSAIQVLEARNLAVAARVWAAETGAGVFPPSHQSLVEAELLPAPAFAADPPLYLGGGLAAEADPSLPLAISAAYRRNGEVLRGVFTVGGDMVEIRDAELDGWIDRAVAARRP